ncbi:MAG: hypothetical protein ACKOBA_12315 [Limnohabitans sp.]
MPECDRRQRGQLGADLPAGAQTHMLALRQQPAHRGIVRWLVDVDPQTI